MRMQVQLAGHAVDFLIGTHLVVQIDGWSYHSSASDRTRDIAHDAALRMRGYTVLRFSYDQVINGWPRVEHALAAAVSRGLHLEPAS
ncbi:endonuclease domain-containing protein [Microbacterium sp. CR_7]|uniref:endonuclease domain-containing protein n=1 Tax=Microbacterium sp. CR_7 TaxID=3055792 RepID=UPI0035BF46C7